MKWFKLITSIFSNGWLNVTSICSFITSPRKLRATLLEVLMGRPKLMIFLGIILFLMHVSSLHIFLSITQLLFFEFLHVPLHFLPMTTFFFFPENRNHLELTGRFDASSSTIRQAIRIELLEVHRYAIHQVSSVGWLVDWMTLKTYGNDVFHFDLEIPVDCWIGGLLGVGCFFTSVLPRKLNGRCWMVLGWGWGGFSAEKTNPRSKSTGQSANPPPVIWRRRALQRMTLKTKQRVNLLPSFNKKQRIKGYYIGRFQSLFSSFMSSSQHQFSSVFFFWGGEFQLCVFFGAWTHLVSAPHFFQVQRSPFCWLVKSLGTDRLFERFISGFFRTAFSIFYLKDDVHNIEYDLMCMSLYVCIYIHVYTYVLCTCFVNILCIHFLHTSIVVV